MAYLGGILVEKLAGGTELVRRMPLCNKRLERFAPIAPFTITSRVFFLVSILYYNPWRACSQYVGCGVA